MPRKYVRLVVVAAATFVFILGTVGTAVGMTVQRLDGHSRYETAVAIARRTFDPTGTKTWGTVDDIIIASGEDRAAADPLSASGLVWAYDAPMFLISSSYVPNEVLVAIKEVYLSSGVVDLHVVGGLSTIPEARIDEIEAYVTPAPATFGRRRFTTTGSRYDLASEIAKYVAIEYGTRNMADPHAVLIANGEDPDKFFDAMALSAISANNGYPILLVKKDSVPPVIMARYNSIGHAARIIGGGPNTISAAVASQLPAFFIERWWGQTRYDTARDVADKALLKGWLTDARVGVAARLPDALTGGAAVGYMGGPLLLTRDDSLPSSASTYLTAHKGNIIQPYIFGGPNSVSIGVEAKMNQLIQ